MVMPRFGAQEMREKVVIESGGGQNLLTSSEMWTVPRVGETFKVGGKAYTVKSVEHNITVNVDEHLILVRVE